MSDPVDTTPIPSTAAIRKLLTKLYGELLRTRTAAQNASLRYAASADTYRAAEVAAVEGGDWTAASEAHTRRAHLLEAATETVVEASMASHHLEAAIAGVARSAPVAVYEVAEEVTAEAGDYVAAAAYAAAADYARRRAEDEPTSPKSDAAT